LGHLTRPTRPQYDYNVFGGMLNVPQSFNPILFVLCRNAVHKKSAGKGKFTASVNKGKSSMKTGHHKRSVCLCRYIKGQNCYWQTTATVFMWRFSQFLCKWSWSNLWFLFSSFLAMTTDLWFVTVTLIFVCCFT